mmetsp:Transcript_32091/g.73346  ORF Transcript_32091/g.73346 Transcript_32091/m.73346 type:complete len:491 (+) Transcript_32091:87-1559(+)
MPPDGSPEQMELQLEVLHVLFEDVQPQQQPRSHLAQGSSSSCPVRSLAPKPSLLEFATAIEVSINRTAKRRSSPVATKNRTALFGWTTCFELNEQMVQSMSTSNIQLNFGLFAKGLSRTVDSGKAGKVIRAKASLPLVAEVPKEGVLAMFTLRNKLGNVAQIAVRYKTKLAESRSPTESRRAWERAGNFVGRVFQRPRRRQSMPDAGGVSSVQVEKKTLVLSERRKSLESASQSLQGVASATTYCGSDDGDTDMLSDASDDSFASACSILDDVDAVEEGERGGAGTEDSTSDGSDNDEEPMLPMASDGMTACRSNRITSTASQASEPGDSATASSTRRRSNSLHDLRDDLPVDGMTIRVQESLIQRCERVAEAFMQCRMQHNLVGMRHLLSHNAVVIVPTVTESVCEYSGWRNIEAYLKLHPGKHRMRNFVHESTGDVSQPFAGVKIAWTGEAYKLGWCGLSYELHIGRDLHVRQVELHWNRSNLVSGSR